MCGVVYRYVSIGMVHVLTEHSSGNCVKTHPYMYVLSYIALVEPCAIHYILHSSHYTCVLYMFVYMVLCVHYSIVYSAADGPAPRPATAAAATGTGKRDFPSGVVLN